MTFVPQQRQPLSRPAAFRTVLFWVLMIALAVVLWQMQTANKKPSAAAWQMSYSDFATQVDNGNVSQAHLYESSSTAEIQGQLRQPPEAFRVTVPKETIPQLMDKLRNRGTNIQVSDMRSAGLGNTLLNLAPFVLILAVWIVIMFWRGRSQSPPPTNAANRPIG